MKQLILTFLLLLLTSTTTWSATYYISPSGDDNAIGTDDQHPWSTFIHADGVLQPGDTLMIMDGTYNQRLNPQTSGTSGNYITYQAQNYLQAILAPTSGSGATLNVYSCPGCGTDVSTKSYLRFGGLMVRGYGESAALNLYSGDNVVEADQTNHIIIKNCGFYGNAQETNTPVISTGPGFRDSLLEDIFAYGRGRKAAEIFSSLRITIRRAVMRYDYWEGDSYKPDDPRVSFTGYNVHDCIFENIIAIDSAPTPVGYSADRSGVAVESNDTPGGLSTTENTKYLGIVNINNYGNGVESDGGSTSTSRNNLIENMVVWKTHDDGEGIDIHGNDDSSIYRFITTGEHDRAGFLVNQHNSNHPITNATVTNVFSLNNGLRGLDWDSAQVSTSSDNTAINNGVGGDIEAAYAPDISTRFLDPVMVAGHERGATIVNRYVDGVQTSTPLWPYPNEDIIKQHMCDSTDLADANRIAANGADWVPGLCATSKTLTEYIWEFNGASCPADICNYTGQTTVNCGSMPPMH